MLGMSSGPGIVAVVLIYHSNPLRRENQLVLIIYEKILLHSAPISERKPKTQEIREN
jgi:hypothetical protein